MSSLEKRKTILIIDDDRTQTTLIEKRLSENGYGVLTANEAASGLQAAMDKYPDMVLLDVMMPIINGYNLCQLLKNDAKHKHIPVIMITSRDQERDKAIGKDVGADDYLTKPIDVPLLLQKIKSFLK